MLRNAVRPPLVRVRSAMLALGLAAGLTAPTSASGALGGAKPLTTTTRADLRSVVVGGTSARWCFDKSLDLTRLTPRDFALGGYRSSALPAHPVRVRYADAPGGLGRACVIGDFTSSSGDLGAYTIGQVAQGAVVGLAGATGNRADAVSLDGSTSHSGARGHTAAPDLVGINVDPLDGTVYFTFDQDIGAVAAPADFHVYAADGTRHDAQDAVFAGRVVRARFDPAATLAFASRGYVGPGAVIGAADSGPNPLSSAVVPTQSGDTARPDLQAAELSPDEGVVDFMYEPGRPLAAGGQSLDPSAFSVSLADGSTLAGTSALIVDESRVRVTFPTSAATGEYVVEAGAREGAVRDEATGTSSSAGAVPLGGNAGALAGGFTTGPDAIAVAFDRASGIATVIFDQRVFSADPAGFHLLDASGANIGAAASSAFIPGRGTRGAAVVQARFTREQVAGARALEIRGYGPGATCTNAGCAGAAATVVTATGNRDAANVQQILSPGRP